MDLPKIIAVVMGLLIAGGMLIPGNIPNIVAAGRLKISMREWAVLGIPIGLVIIGDLLCDFAGYRRYLNNRIIHDSEAGCTICFNFIYVTKY